MTKLNDNNNPITYNINNTFTENNCIFQNKKKISEKSNIILHIFKFLSYLSS